MNASTARLDPIDASTTLYDAAMVDEYLAMLFGNVDWQPGQVFSLLGIGEKGTAQEGVFRERKIISPGFIGMAHGHLQRWAGHQVAGFIVPAVLHATAEERGDVTLDKLAALTAIVLDLDSGDVNARAKFVIERLGKPTMMVASGGVTETGQKKGHAYWRLDEPCEDVERVAALRKLLASKCGGDQSFGRATQVIRVPGSVHAKNGNASLCRIVERNAIDYSLDDLAEIIENMLPMPGLPEPVQNLHTLPALANGFMDFTPPQDTAQAALHRDVHEGGSELTRWGEFNKVAGFAIREARDGRMTPAQAAEHARGWMLSHMVPPWPEARFQQEFVGLWNADQKTNGPMPAPPAPWSGVARSERLPMEFFEDIKGCLKNAWRIRDVLPEAATGVIYGSPAAGKSFLALDMALRMSAGWPLDGHAVKQCPVVYIVAEGQGGFRRRVDAWRRHHNPIAKLPFVIFPCVVDLLNPQADLQRLIEQIKEAEPRLGGSPGAIFVDTLAQTFGGGDENTGRDMGAYVNNVAKLREAFATSEASAIIVHHRPKDTMNGGPRGHGNLIGAVDTIIRLDYERGTRSAALTKQKDGEEGHLFVFELERVHLGEDGDGEPVTSAVVRYLVPPVTAELTSRLQTALDALRAAIDAAQGDAVPEASWRETWAAGLPDTMAGEKPDTRRKRFERARDELRNAGRIVNPAGAWSIVEPLAAPLMDFSPG